MATTTNTVSIVTFRGTFCLRWVMGNLRLLKPHTLNPKEIFQPPATAGTILTSSPSLRAVSAPSKKRISSLLT